MCYFYAKINIPLECIYIPSLKLQLNEIKLLRTLVVKNAKFQYSLTGKRVKLYILKRCRLTSLFLLLHTVGQNWRVKILPPLAHLRSDR